MPNLKYSIYKPAKTSLMMLYAKHGIMTEELCSRYIKNKKQNKTLHCYIINSLQEQGYYSPQVCTDPFFIGIVRDKRIHVLSRCCVHQYGSSCHKEQTAHTKLVGVDK